MNGVTEETDLKDIGVSYGNGHRGLPHWQWFALFVVGIISLSLLVYVGILSRNGFSAVQLQRTSAARVDCFSAVNAARNDVISQVTIDKATADQAFYALVLNSQAHPGEGPDPVLLSLFGAATTDLGKSVKVAKALPTRDQIVNSGGTIAGVHYAACPKI